MTYRQMRKKLSEMQESRLDDDVTVYDRDNDEYRPVLSVKETGEECDVLDEGHTVIVV